MKTIYNIIVYFDFKIFFFLMLIIFFLSLNFDTDFYETEVFVLFFLTKSSISIVTLSIKFS